MREITVATVQMKPELGRVEDNLVKMSDLISTITSQQKVDLIIFPELITSGYELGVQFTEIAQRIPGPAINLMAQRAADAGVYIAFGLATKEKVESILYNTAVLVGPEGELLGHYSKVHLRGEERMAFREGFKLPVIDTGEIGKIGMMLGWDLAFPEVARALALEGAELICCLANWERQYIDEFKTYVRSRAYENALFIAAANRVGEDVTINFGGESMIVGPRGKIHAALETESEERKAWSREQQDLMREIQSLKDSKVAMEAARELDAAKNAAKKEADTAKKDGVAVSTETPAVSSAAADLSAVVTAPISAPKAEEPVKLGEPATPKVSALENRPRENRESVPGRKPSGDKGGKSEAAEGFCVARIDLDEVRHFREEFQTLQARQPTVYKALVRRY